MVDVHNARELLVALFSAVAAENNHGRPFIQVRNCRPLSKQWRAAYHDQLGQMGVGVDHALECRGRLLTSLACHWLSGMPGSPEMGSRGCVFVPHRLWALMEWLLLGHEPE